MLMCIDCMYHVIIGSSTKRCVAFLTVVGGLFSLNTMDIPSNTCRRWAPTIVINGVMGPYKWPKTNGVTGVILLLLMGTPFITGDGAHLVYLFDNMSSIQRI